MGSDFSVIVVGGDVLVAVSVIFGGRNISRITMLLCLCVCWILNFRAALFGTHYGERIVGWEEKRRGFGNDNGIIRDSVGLVRFFFRGNIPGKCQIRE